MTENERPILEFNDVTKIYPGTIALKDCSMSVKRGEVMGLVGKNGAGKSTLLKILTGAIEATKGSILLNGNRLKGDPNEIRQMGISMVYQSLNLPPHLTVEEYIFLGREIVKGGKWIKMIHHEKQKKKIRELMDSIGIDIDLDARIYSLKIDIRQMVAIIRASSLNAKVIALDEPTSSLSRGETEKLFSIIRRFKKLGISFIFVSHHLDEVFEITDRIAVIRDGKLQGVRNTSEVTMRDLTALMLGKRAVEEHERIIAIETKNVAVADSSKKVLLRVSNLSKEGAFSGISFDLCEKDILGVAGLMGSGKSELAEALFGSTSLDSGEIFLHGEKKQFHSPAQAIRNDVVYLPPDRIGEGIFETMSVGENIIIENLSKVSRKGITSRKRQMDIGNRYIHAFKIKTNGYNQPITDLSGGNQQKALFARLLNTNCNILILNEPTQGIDVMIKEEIYALMIDFVNAAPNRAIIMISGEVPEIISVSSRVLVMKNGELAGIIPREKATESIILNTMI